ncbi:SRPBCC family protein [Salinimicrobium flavum]|uniref:SRPBCC family protein n=1 Tax=Salinimicrobium flavum TaxID=1737065 RepID=A0ABW5IX47_9FLAO
MKNLIPHFHINVSPTERAVSLLAGAWFLYDGLGKDKKSVLETVIAGYLLYRGATGNCAAYSAMGKTKPDNHSRNVNIQIRQIVNKPREEVYQFWKDFENLPLFMEHLENVVYLNDDISVWEANLPGGLGKIRWKSEIVKDRPNELIGWHSLPGSAVENAGKVEFRDMGEGTEVHVVISYHAPGGLPGEGAARLINPVFEDMIRQDVENFKWFIEREYLH